MRPSFAEPIKAAHFVLGPSDPRATAVRFEDAIRIVDLAAELEFNTVVLQIANGVMFDAAPELSRKGAWTRAQLTEFARHAREQGLDVIPEFKFLTHQEKFLAGHYPELMYNVVTYDPRESGVYDIVFAVLDEVIELINPRAISIGHDEVVGWNPHHAKRNLAAGETMLPADLFLADVVQLHEYLETRNVETWMWGDMLISPGEFPDMEGTYLHGTTGGYGKALRDQIPRSIVICDWHYSGSQAEFPSVAMLQSEGFEVIGAVWENPITAENFSRYVADSGAAGMMATTWFYVPQRRWERVEKILRTSASAFRILDEKNE
jgi:hypothetical protein